METFCFFTTQASENKNKPLQTSFGLHFQFCPHLFYILQSGVSNSQNIKERECKNKKWVASYRSSWAELGQRLLLIQSYLHCVKLGLTSTLPSPQGRPSAWAPWIASLFPHPRACCCPSSPPTQNLLSNATICEDRLQRKTGRAAQSEGWQWGSSLQKGGHKKQLEMTHLGGRCGLSVMWNCCPSWSNWVGSNCWSDKDKILSRSKQIETHIKCSSSRCAEQETEQRDNHSFRSGDFFHQNKPRDKSRHPPREVWEIKNLKSLSQSFQTLNASTLTP